MVERTIKRQVIWEEMGRLAALGVGHRVAVSDLRDKFVLDPSHPSAYKLSQRPEANGFIRAADERGLLFRSPSDALQRQLAACLSPDIHVDHGKGFGLGWNNVEVEDLRRMFEVVTRLANDGQE